MGLESLLNQTEIFGVLTNSATNQLTGDVMLTFLGILVLFLMFLMAFRVPLDLAVGIILPIILMFSAFVGGFQIVLTITLLYLGFVFAKNFII